MSGMLKNMCGLAPLAVLRRCKRQIAIVCTLSLGLGAGSVHAQEPSLEEMRRSIELVSGVLREGLDLNTRAGIFSPLNGSVRGSYYMQQGVVLEIVSPLSNSRTAFSWQSFEGSLQQLSGQISSLVSVPRVPAPELEAMRESIALSLDANAVQEAYVALLERVRGLNFSAEIEQALAQVSASARSLHALGEIDDARLNALMEEVSTWRRVAGERINALRALQGELSGAQLGAALDSATSTATQTYEETLAQILAALAPLREQATARAEQLAALAEQAQRERELQWQQELADFEVRLFALLCDYGAALRVLPDGERLTLVLKGVGGESAARREDRIHVLSKAQLQGCLQDELDAEQLRGGAVTYSF